MVSRAKKAATLSAIAILLAVPQADGEASGHAHSSPAAVRCTHRNPASGTITLSDAFAGPEVSAGLGGIAEEFTYDDLFRYDSTGHLFPMMAAAIPTVHNGGIRNGGRTVVVHLKPGLRWSNGTEITSADVKFGWRVDMDPASGSGGPACAGTCDVVSSVDTPDRYTAVFHLKAIDPSFVSPNVDAGGNMPRVWAKGSPAWIGDPHVAAQKLGSLDLRNPAYLTDGPYQAVSLSQNRLTLRAMKYYDDMRCGASIRSLALTTYNTGDTPSTAAQVQAAIGGRIDIGTNYAPVDAPNLTRHRGSYDLHVEPTFTFEHLEFNLDSSFQGRANPLADTRVRLALALALDKISIIRSALALTTKQAQKIEAWTPWVHTSHLTQPYTDPGITGQWDPLANRGRGAYVSATGSGQALADARRLLSSTRWKNGFTLEMYTTQKPERLVMMPLVAAAWKRLGVTVRQHPVGFGVLFTPWSQGGIAVHGAFQVLLFAEAGAPSPDPMFTLMESPYVDRDQTAHTSDNVNYAGIRDRTIDQAFSQAVRTFDNRVRKRAFAIVQERLNQRAYWIPLYYVPSISTNDHHVGGFKPNPIFGMDAWNSYDWRVR
jgi:ABC-type transport system substrate-binding protein